MGPDGRTGSKGRDGEKRHWTDCLEQPCGHWSRYVSIQLRALKQRSDLRYLGYTWALGHLLVLCTRLRNFQLQYVVQPNLRSTWRLLAKDSGPAPFGPDG